jgi:6-phosphogluconolactonase (cycloisomerase 2 family)
MRTLSRAGLAAATALAGIAALTAFGAPASAATVPGRQSQLASRDGGAVFVQTDNPAGNQIAAYQRAPGGTLRLAGTYATGGLGGVLNGSVVDHLASQGSLGYDRGAHLLIAVNAGSNSVSAFSVRGDSLVLSQVIGSGGTFPVSVAIRGDIAYVLNARNGGSVQGYRVRYGRLFPVPGSNRSLGLSPSATPQYTNTPGQVAFSPDGTQLIVTTKANGNDIDVFGVLPGGQLTASPVVNAEPGTVPFAISFDLAGHLVVAEAGTDALATFTLSADGTVTLLDALGTGQSATCWVTPADGLFYASNAGSATLSRFAVSATGQLTLLGATSTDPGTVDSAATPNGRFLYVQTGAAGIVDEFAIGAGGSLTEIGSVTVAGAAGGEGIVAS